MRTALALLPLMAAAGSPGSPSKDARGQTTVCLLTYHRIADPASSPAGTAASVTCPPAQFLEHLRFLREQGYETLTFADLDDWKAGRRAAPRRAVVLTFDDGTADHWDAAQTLARHGQHGVFFVVTSWLGRPGYLTQAQVRALPPLGMEVGSHSRTHANLSKLAPDALEDELCASGRELGRLLERPVIALAYPGGKYDAGIARMARRCGYHYARTTLPGVWRGRDRAAMDLPAISIRAETTAPKLAAGIERWSGRDDP